MNQKIYIQALNNYNTRLSEHNKLLDDIICKRETLKKSRKIRYYSFITPFFISSIFILINYKWIDVTKATIFFDAFSALVGFIIGDVMSESYVRFHTSFSIKDLKEEIVNLDIKSMELQQVIKAMELKLDCLKAMMDEKDNKRADIIAFDPNRVVSHSITRKRVLTKNPCNND